MLEAAAGAIRSVLARLRARWPSGRADREVREEIASHVEEATHEYARQGLTPSEARRAALRDFGGVAQAIEAHRDLRSFAWIDRGRRDLRHAGRAIGRNPGFAVTVFAVLALGTAAATSVLTLLSSIVLRPLPYPDAHELVTVSHDAPAVSQRDIGISSGLYVQYQDRASHLESLGAYSERMLTLQTADRSERIAVTYATASFFRVLGVAPVAGRLFTDADATPGFMNMKWAIPVLLSHGLWVDRFGADPAIVGRTLTLSDNPRLVVGVLPEHFAFPSADTSIWMLMESPAASVRVADSFGRRAVARLRPGAGAAAAREELAGIVAGLPAAPPDPTVSRLAELRIAPVVTPLRTTVIGGVGAILWPLFGGMVLLLSIAAVNAGGLFLVRAEHRQREMAVRRALGAGGGDITRLYFVEALLLTSAAAAAGLLLTALILPRVVHRLPIALPRAAEVSIDAVTVLFVGVTALLSAVFVAVIATGRGGRLDVALAGAGTRATGAPRRRRTRELLIALQIALALTLLAGSALMVRTYWNLSRVPLGFSPDRLLTIEVSLASRKYREHTRIFTGLATRLRQLPGVDAASAVSSAPLTPIEHFYPIDTAGSPVAFKFFLPGYFETMKIPVPSGRSLTIDEPRPAPHPVVVSDPLARRLFPGGALGASFERRDTDGRVMDVGGAAIPPFTVAGVAAGVRETTLRAGPADLVYVPVMDPPVEISTVPMNMTAVVRTRVPPLDLADAVRREIQATDSALSIGRIRTMASIVERARAPETLVGALLVTAALVSALLGIVGIYGSVAHASRLRAREIGIRLALGARAVEVIAMVGRGSLRGVVAGVAAGVALALLTTRALGTLLFEVGAVDPLTLGIVTTLLVSAAAGAAFLAAWRGSRIDPLVALREE